MNPEDFDANLELFYGAANVNTATIYARLLNQPTGAGVTLSGFVRGPHCLHSTMLPATIRLADAGPGDSLLAKAIVPDPCYWTPELPALYDVHVELKRDGETIAAVDSLFGMRQFGPRGKFFYLNGKRWTLRAAYTPQAPIDLLAWHDTPLALFADCPSDALCDEASRVGVFVIAELGAGHDLETELRRLSRHAAVGLIVIDGAAPADLQQLTPNVILARRFQDSTHAAEATNAAAFVCDVRALSPLAVPVIAQRLLEQPVDPAEARLQCDRLQAELAPLGDFAGYLV